MTILTHLLVFVIGTVAGMVLASLLEASHRKDDQKAEPHETTRLSDDLLNDEYTKEERDRINAKLLEQYRAGEF